MALSLMLAVAACGGISPSSGSPSTRLTAAQLCKLVTQAEVSAALSSSVGPGVPSGINAPSCNWTGPTPRNAGLTIAGIAGADVNCKLRSGLQGLQNATVTPVNGLGDAAFLASANGLPNADLTVRKRDQRHRCDAAWVQITQGQQVGAEGAIARAAVGRM